MRPATILSVTVLVLTALGLITTNDRLDLWGARGAAGGEGLAIAFLVLAGVVVAAVDLLWRPQWLPYALTPITAILVVLSYTFGTMRFD